MLVLTKQGCVRETVSHLKPSWLSQRADDSMNCPWQASDFSEPALAHRDQFLHSIKLHPSQSTCAQRVTGLRIRKMNLSEYHIKV